MNFKVNELSRKLHNNKELTLVLQHVIEISLKTLAFRDSAKNRVVRFPPRKHEISVENREFRNFHGKSWIFTKFC